MLDAAIAVEPTMITLSFGDPASYVGRIHDAGIPVVSQINTLEDLRIVEAAGVDGVIAQGGEAGGHTAESEPCRCCRRSSKRHHFQYWRPAESGPAAVWPQSWQPAGGKA